MMCTDAEEAKALDDGVGQTRSGGMTIVYEQRPKYGVRDETKHIDTPMGLVPMNVTTEVLVNLEEIFMT